VDTSLHICLPCQRVLPRTSIPVTFPPH
jgi:hypothetical protein